MSRDLKYGGESESVQSNKGVTEEGCGKEPSRLPGFAGGDLGVFLLAMGRIDCELSFIARC